MKRIPAPTLVLLALVACTPDLRTLQIDLVGCRELGSSTYDGDLWRLEIHGRRAVKIQPRIVWPDGTEETPR